MISFIKNNTFLWSIIACFSYSYPSLLSNINLINTENILLNKKAIQHETTGNTIDGTSLFTCQNISDQIFNSDQEEIYLTSHFLESINALSYTLENWKQKTSPSVQAIETALINNSRTIKRSTAEQALKDIEILINNNKENIPEHTYRTVRQACQIYAQQILSEDAALMPEILEQSSQRKKTYYNLSIRNALKVGNALHVCGNGYIQGTFTVCQTAQFNGPTVISFPQGPQNALTVFGNTNLNGNLIVTGTVTAANFNGGETLDRFLAADGSSQAPAFSFIDNQNTGIYQPANNQIGISIGGTPIALLTSSGITFSVSVTAPIFNGNLNGTATNFSGPLQGDVTGTQNNTIVSFVGGQSATNVALATTLVLNATSLNIPNTLVRRDGDGSFNAQDITAEGDLTAFNTVSGATGAFSANIIIPNTTSFETGNIIKNVGGTPTSFIHNFGTNNTFVGLNAGNFTTTGTNNTALGASAQLNSGSGDSNTSIGFGSLSNNISGDFNICLGYNSGNTTTTGGSNIYIGESGATPNESNTTRIGQQPAFDPLDPQPVIPLPQQQSRFFAAGVLNSQFEEGFIPVVVNLEGQLGTQSLLRFTRSSENLKNLDNTNDVILKLRPVENKISTKSGIQKTQIGLIPEEVEKIYPPLAIHNKQGEPYLVRYDLLPVLLIKELQKQHDLIESLKKELHTIKTHLKI